MEDNYGARNNTAGNLDIPMNQGALVEGQEMFINDNHGEKIKHYRMAKGFDRKYMAERIGMTPDEYTEMEKKKVVEDDILQKAAEILNLGVEWLKIVPVHTGTHYYYQDGNGSYYQNTGDAYHSTTIHKPVEEVVMAFEKAIGKIEELYSKSLEEKNITISALRQDLTDVKAAQENLLLKIANYAFDQK